MEAIKKNHPKLTAPTGGSNGPIFKRLTPSPSTGLLQTV
jgi:hypothetical protein